MQLKVFRPCWFLMLLFAAVPAFAQEDTKKNDRPPDGATAPVREQNQKQTDETRYQYEFAQ